MKKTIEGDAKYKDMKLVTTVYGDDDPQKSTTEAEALLANQAHLRGIISPTTVGVAATAQVVETAKKADTVKVDRPRHAEPDAPLRRERHARGVPALEPLQ